MSLLLWLLLPLVAPQGPAVRWTRVNPAVGSGTFEAFADGRWRATASSSAREGAPVTGRVAPEALEALRKALVKHRFCQIRSTHQPGAGVLENFETLSVEMPGVSCTLALGSARKLPARADLVIKAFRAFGTAAHGGGEYDGPALPGIEGLLVEPASAPPPGARIARRVERRFLDEALRDEGQAARDVRVRPVHEGGKPAGLALSQVRQNGVFWRVGLEDGDVVRSVNGLPLTGPEQALAAYSRLKATSHLTIVLARGGKAMTLEVDIVP